MCRKNPIIFSVVLILGLISTVLGGAFVFALEKDAAPDIPRLTNDSYVRYWGYNSDSSVRDGKGPERPAQYLLNLTVHMKSGGKIVISDKGWIGRDRIIDTGSCILITGKDVDGKYYYDPASPNLSDQRGMFMINANTTFGVASDVIFENTVILERNRSDKLSTIDVLDGGRLLIEDSVLFCSSVNSENTRLHVSAGGTAILRAAGFSSYTGEGRIYVDSSLLGSSALTEALSEFEGDIYTLDGARVCSINGHDEYVYERGGVHYFGCRGCEHEVMCEYSLPTLECEDEFYWAHFGSDSNSGTDKDHAKSSIGALSKIVNEGGRIYIVQKAYASASVTARFDGTAVISAVLADGTDYRELDSQWGALMWAHDSSMTFEEDIIFDRVNIYSRTNSVQTLRITKGATALFSDVECKVSDSRFPTNQLYIDAQSTCIFMGDNVGSFSAILGEGLLVVDEKLIENGKLTRESLDSFSGTVITTDYEILQFPEKKEREIASPADAYLTSTYKTMKYAYCLPDGYDEDKVYPLVVYLHGSDAVGTDGKSHLTSREALLNTEIYNSGYGCIMLAPQCKDSGGWVSSTSSVGSSSFFDRDIGAQLSCVAELVSEFAKNYNVDTDRIYLIGNENGAAGALELAYRYPNTYAAVIAVSGARATGGWERFAQGFGTSSVWLISGEKDAGADIAASREMADAMREAGRSIVYTELSGITADNLAFEAARQTHIARWLFSKTKNSQNSLAGDINRDRASDVTDITLLVRYLSGWDIGYDTDIADLNCDGKISNRDALSLIIESVSSLGTSLGIPSFSFEVGNILDYSSSASADKVNSDEHNNTLEYSYRDQHVLVQNDYGLERAYYPRIKMLGDGSYILLYQNHNTGDSVFYALSTDMENWTYKGKLFAASGSKWYATGDGCLLSNGDFVVVASFNTDYSGNAIKNGVCLRRTRDNGKTWSEEVVIYRGTTWEPSIMQLSTGEVQVYFTNTHVNGASAEHGGRADDNSTGTMMIRSFDNCYTWTSDLSYAYSGQVVAQQWTKLGSDGNYYSGQMPVACELKNGRIVLALEVRLPKVNDPDSDTYNLALAYSPVVNSWPDSLGVDEEGPDTLVRNAYIGFSGPYIRQFAHGPTLLTYHWSGKFMMLFGNSSATAFEKAQTFYTPSNIHQWGCIELTAPHKMTGVVPSADRFELFIGSYYLDHTLCANTETPIRVDGGAGDWESFGEAIFVGSESQAQCSVRVAADEEYIYFYADVLDDNVTLGDRVELRIADESGKVKRLVAYPHSDMALIDENGALIITDTVDVRAYVSGTYGDDSDSDAGYVIEMRVDRATVAGNADTIRLCPMLYNTDAESDGCTIDVAGEIDVNSPNSWLDILLDK